MKVSGLHADVWSFHTMTELSSGNSFASIHTIEGEVGGMRTAMSLE